jgi:hypothetical protein
LGREKWWRQVVEAGFRVSRFQSFKVSKSCALAVELLNLETLKP